MKVTIIGGGGRVGSCAAYALQCGGLVSEIQILDANKDLAEGEALDLFHGSAFAGDHKIYAGDYGRAADSDIFVITASVKFIQPIFAWHAGSLALTVSMAFSNNTP